MKLYLAHSDDFFTIETSLYLQTYFPRDFLTAPPERGERGVGIKLMLSILLYQNFNHKFKTESLVALFCWLKLKLKHY